MLVPPALAWPTILALHTRRRSHGAIGGTGLRDVVVSRETEPIVLQLLRDYAPRSIYTTSVEVLELPDVCSTREMRPMAICSTSPDANPRLPRRSYSWDMFL
mmetsp:Transcript_45142/g.144591  ORF Transcript_45142/g.144591 Transcript_45142/m.144591 type:complete len:102 (-) Transcript_45142:380-685(-)